MTIYKKLSENEYEIIETEEVKSVVKLDFVEQDIAHKDKLIAELQEGIDNLEKEKTILIALKNNLLKAK